MVYLFKLLEVKIFRKLNAEKLIMTCNRYLMCYPMLASYIASYSQYHASTSFFLIFSVIPMDKSRVLSPMILEPMLCENIDDPVAQGNAKMLSYHFQDNIR